MADNRQDRNVKHRNKELKRLNILRLERMEMNNIILLPWAKKEKPKTKIRKPTYCVNQNYHSGVIRYSALFWSFKNLALSLYTFYA